MILPHARIPTGLARGATGEGVEHLQEWLTLAGYPLLIDGDFGPATERALVAWRDSVHAPICGDPGAVSAVDAATLTAPLWRALSARGSIPHIARAYLAEHPREVGGQNRGPWVRTFCDGREGEPWCGFAARHIARQAGDPWAERISPSCDVTAARALHDGRWSSTPTVGGLFLVRRTPTDWTHMGIVLDAGPGWISTWEGNANDEGGREGHEVCGRTRGVGRLDFVRLGA
jgi:hypothetical protein